MPYAKRRYSKRQPYSRRTAATKIARAYRKKATSKVFTAKVNRVIARKTETKMRSAQICNNAQVYGAGLSLPGSLTSYGLCIANIWHHMTVAQGTSQQQRIGNSINPKSLRLSGVVKSNQFASSTNNSTLGFELHMILYKYKTANTGDPSRIVSLTNNQAGAIDGTAQRSLLPWNKDEYIIKKHRVFKMRCMPVHANIAEVPPSSDPVALAVNPQPSSYTAFQRFRVTVPTPKVLKFGDGQDTPHEQCSLGFYVVDGSGNSLAASQTRATVYCDATLRYTDS